MSDKKTFISYSHSDREFAERLAHALMARGIDVWWDQWEMQPGDSIVAKIFGVGLSQASHFLILLSPDSVASKWVREELDIATVRRIEDSARVVPVLLRNTEIPTSLRALFWVDMRTGFDQGVDQIANAVHGISSKPPVGPAPPVAAVDPIQGFSRAATAVGALLVESYGTESPIRTAFMNSELSAELKLEPADLNDAVDELEDGGLVAVLRAVGTGPYRFYQIEPTYVLFREFDSLLDYDPQRDVREVAAAAVAAKSGVRGPALQELTGLSPDRINRAVDYLADYGVAHVIRGLGTSPFNFREIHAHHRTRQYVVELDSGENGRKSR